MPPSSSVTRFIVAAPSRMMISPTATEPVKEILATSGCARVRRRRNAEARDDVQETVREPRLMQALHQHPCLQSAHLAWLDHRRAARGDGWASLRHRNSAFAFQGVIRPATPTGSRVTVVLSQLRDIGSSCECLFSREEHVDAQLHDRSPANWRTPLYSSTIDVRQIADPRRNGLVQEAQDFGPLFFCRAAKTWERRLAAAIARRASSSSASVTWAMTSPFVGLMMSMSRCHGSISRRRA